MRAARARLGGDLGPLRARDARLEEDFARYCGTRFCLAMNSGTGALHCAVGAAGIGPRR